MNFKNLLLLGCALAMCAAAATAQVPSYVPTDGLVGWWPFNGNANDESGNGHDCSVVEAVLSIDRFGNSSNSYTLAGATGFIRTNNPFYNSSIDHSVSFWIQVADSADQNVSFFNTDPHTIEAFGYNYNLNPARHFHFFLGNGLNGISGWNVALNNSFNEQPPITSFNDWFHYAVVLQGTQWTFYINSELVHTFNGAQSTSSVLADVFFGNDVTNTAAINGSIDDIVLYNRALTPQEIQDLYIGCAVLPTTIAGELEPVTLSASSYACNNNAGSTYAWSVTNGVISSGQGTANVSVLWGEEGAGILTVVETNAEGCSGTAVTIDVNVVCAISITAINGPLGPNELTATTYSCDGSGTSTYQWTITNGVITAGQGTSTVTVLWASTGLGSLSVQETTQAKCTSDVISIDVVVIPTSISEETEAVLAVYPNPVQNEINIRSTLQAIGSNYTLLGGAGKLVSNGKINSTLTTIHASTLAAGTYVLRVGETFEQTIQVVR